MPNILVIDDEPKMTYLVEGALTDAGFQVTAVNTPNEALKLIDSHCYDIIVTDFSMPKITGLEILEKAREKGDAAVVIMTAYGTVENAVEAMKKGAADYIMKPFPMDELVIICRKLTEKQRLIGLTDMLTEDIKGISYDKFIGRSRAAREMLDMISRVAATDATVLLTGKSGTGKELAAHLIHENSPRKEKPFIPVNCAALTETLPGLAGELVREMQGL